MGDNPVTPGASMSNKTLQVGDLGAQRPEKFVTYVMYKPTLDDLAVWVALAKVEWEWGALASNNNQAGGLPANWRLQPFPGLSEPSKQNEIGPGADDRVHWYPRWNSRATEIIDSGWQAVP